MAAVLVLGGVSVHQRIRSWRRRQARAEEFEQDVYRADTPSVVPTTEPT